MTNDFDWNWKNKLQKKSKKRESIDEEVNENKFSIFWQQRFNDECDRLRQENARLQSEYDEQIRSLNERVQSETSQNTDHRQVIDRDLILLL